MNKKVVIIGGGTGTATLVSGLKKFPVDISVVVSVLDDGASTGRLREEFNIPAVGDLRKVIASLSDTEPLFESLLEYRFNTDSDLNGHPIGNLLLTALCDITKSTSKAALSLSKILNIKGNVLALTDDNINLICKMKDGSIIKGEHNITKSNKVIKKLYYDKKITINPLVLKSIKEADLIILSMGSIYTSIICNLISKQMKDEIDKSKAKVLYVCNMFTQPGESDDFKVSDHIKVLNNYLGKKKIDVVIANSGKIKDEYLNKYVNEEQKHPVIIDEDEINKLKVRLINDDFVTLKNDLLRHDEIKLALKIFSELIK